MLTDAKLCAEPEYLLKRPPFALIQGWEPFSLAELNESVRFCLLLEQLEPEKEDIKIL